ncbi:hypothetical protein ACQEU3_24945 [Spirillospora sp. CA-253888]
MTIKIRRSPVVLGALASALGGTALVATPAYAEDQTCHGSVCVKVGREGVWVDFIQGYHHGGSGAWKGKIDLTREGYSTIQGAVDTPPPPVFQRETLRYRPGARICALGFEYPGWKGRGEACVYLR